VNGSTGREEGLPPSADPRAGASPPRLLVQLARKTGCAFSRIFGVGLR
jgi:hypothetical protein